jgi:hypothetical protein
MYEIKHLNQRLCACKGWDAWEEGSSGQGVVQGVAGASGICLEAKGSKYSHPHI